LGGCSTREPPPCPGFACLQQAVRSMPALEIQGDEEQARAEEQREALLQNHGMNREYVQKITALSQQNAFSFASETVKGYNPRFVKAMGTAVRVAFWTGVTGFLVWRARHMIPLDSALVTEGHIFTYLPNVVLAIIFNVTPNLASTCKSCFQAFVGTLASMMAAWLLYHCPLVSDASNAAHATAATISVAPTCPGPGHVFGKAGNSTMNDLYHFYCVSSNGLFTFDNNPPGWPAFCALAWFALFVWIVLSLNVVMPFKTFALLGMSKFMLDFANPQTNTDMYLDFLNVNSVASLTILTQLLGSAFVILAMLLPPLTATNDSKVLAARSTKVISELIVHVTDYYAGSEKTLKIAIWNTLLEKNRVDMSEEGAILDASWWEHYDWSSKGVARRLMLQHLDMLKDLDRRLAVMQICVLREQFEASHKAVMAEIKLELSRLVQYIGDLLMNSMLAASDGHFSADEKAQLNKEKKLVDDAIVALGAKWRTVRKNKSPLSEEMRPESFFVVEISTMGRLVSEFTEQVLESKPESKFVAIAAIGTMIKSREELKPGTEFGNFVLRNWISLMIAFVWAMLSKNFGTGMITYVVLMLTEHPGNQLFMNLNKLQASVLGSLTGCMMFRWFHHCAIYVKIMKVLCLFVFEFVANFISNYSTEFQLVGQLLAVNGGVKLLSACDDILSNGEVMSGAAAEFAGLKAIAEAIMVVAAVDSLLKPESACDQARARLLEAMDASLSYFGDFTNGKFAAGKKQIWEDSAKKTEEIETLLSKAKKLGEGASVEPRYTKGSFKTELFNELCARMLAFQLNTQILVRRCQGSDVGLFEKMSKCTNWALVKNDLDETVKDTQLVVKEVISWDGFGALASPKVDLVLDKAGLDKIDGLRRLVKDLEAEMKSHAPVEGISMEDDQISRFCVVIEMLDTLIKCLVDMLTITVQHF